MGSPQSGKKQLRPKCDGQQRLAGRETAHGIAEKRLSDDIAGTREARKDCGSAKIVAGIELLRLCSIIPDSRTYFHVIFRNLPLRMISEVLGKPGYTTDLGQRSGIVFPEEIRRLGPTDPGPAEPSISHSTGNWRARFSLHE